jgi:hypothetical protein
MTAPMFLRQQGARASRQDPHDSTIDGHVDVLRIRRRVEKRPGSDSLLHLSGWPRVDKVLQAIEVVEALGIDPAAAAPDYWRHVHNRLSAGTGPVRQDRAAACDRPGALLSLQRPWSNSRLRSRALDRGTDRAASWVAGGFAGGCVARSAAWRLR